VTLLVNLAFALITCMISSSVFFSSLYRVLFLLFHSNSMATYNLLEPELKIKYLFVFFILF